MGYENWTQALGGWIEEKDHYFYGYPATGIVGHYTQVDRTTENNKNHETSLTNLVFPVQIIWHSAVLVGCAATMCPSNGQYNIAWPFYVCNYVTG